MSAELSRSYNFPHSHAQAWTRSSFRIIVLLAACILIVCALAPQFVFSQPVGRWFVRAHIPTFATNPYFAPSSGTPVTGCLATDTSGGFILYTRDGGATWSRSRIAGSFDGSAPGFVDFCFKDNLTGWATTRYGAL